MVKKPAINRGLGLSRYNMEQFAQVLNVNQFLTQQDTEDTENEILGAHSIVSIGGRTQQVEREVRSSRRTMARAMETRCVLVDVSQGMSDDIEFARELLESVATQKIIQVLACAAVGQTALNSRRAGCFRAPLRARRRSGGSRFALTPRDRLLGSCADGGKDENGSRHDGIARHQARHARRGRRDDGRL